MIYINLIIHFKKYEWDNLLKKRVKIYAVYRNNKVYRIGNNRNHKNFVFRRAALFQTNISCIEVIFFLNQQLNFK